MADADSDDVAMRPRGGGGKAGAMRPRIGNALRQPVELEGLAQVVGLALGAPEFQRR